MKKRIIAALLIISLCMSLTDMSVFANVQIQVKQVKIDEVYFAQGQDPITGAPMIRPTMKISWENPASWAPTADGSDIHSPDYYEVIVNNITNNTSDTIRVSKGTDEFNNRTVYIHEKIGLSTGSLYNVTVRPYHYHENELGNLIVAPSTGVAENAYAITDLNVRFETTESSIQIVWDDLGISDFTYRIVYAQGDFSTKSKTELINNKVGDIQGLTSDSDGVTRFYDPIERKNKLSYTIDENIYPGQVYSVMVEPTVEYYNGKPIMRNRNYPMIRTSSTNVKLDLYEEGDYIRLEWNIPASFKVGQNQSEYALVEATIMQYRNGQSSNVVIFNGDASKIGYYRIPKPARETEYEIRFVYTAVQDVSKPPIEPVSNRAVYVPSELLITPTKPYVPKFISESILKNIRDNNSTQDAKRILETEYFVPGYTYNGNLDDLLSQNVTFHIPSGQEGILLTWGAFKRIDVDESSPTFNQYIFDHNVYYDIWVTDSLESMAYAIKIVDTQRFGDPYSSNNISDGVTIYGYNYLLNSYYDSDKGELKSISPNQLYYIKLVAKKKTSMGYLTSEPTILTLYYSYGGDAFEPPVITSPPLEVKDTLTTPTSVTFGWYESWYEIMSPDANTGDVLSAWRSKVWVTADGQIHGNNVINSTAFEVFKGEDEIQKLRNYLSSLGASINIVSRFIDLGQDEFGVSDVKYNFYKIPYEQVLDEIGKAQKSNPGYDFDDYFADLIRKDKDGTKKINWTRVSPTTDSQTGELSYTANGLLPNTTYLMLLYPYRELNNGDVLYAHYPTPIVSSTKPEEIIVTPDPTVPNLYISEPTTDMSITVMWKYNTDFTYELMYGQVEDISKATSVPIVLPTNTADPKYPQNGKYYYITVNDLFPNTTYYFWLRAKQPATNKTSRWSNAVIGRTKDVDAPYPPKGFGIASLESMRKHGYGASVSQEYIAIEWLLDPSDVPMDVSKNVQKNYSYVLEVSDNAQFIDPTIIESSGGVSDTIPSFVEVLEKGLIKINGLLPNKPYYVRVKTRVTVKSKNNALWIVKDSAYTPAIRIVTIQSDKEYDGSIDTGGQALPSDDFELTYNADTDTLTYRFRSDASGDYNVDQRLISKIISQNIYRYTISIASYNDQPIKTRVIEIPYSVIEAFTEYKVSMFVDAGDLQIELPYGSFATSVNQQVKQYGAKPSVIIRIDQMDKNYLEKQRTISNLRSVSTASNITISVNSTRLNAPLYYTDKELTIGLKVNNAYEGFRVERIGTVKDVKGVWSDIASNYNTSTGVMTYKTAKVGTYGGYVMNPLNAGITSDSNHWSSAYRKEVTLDYSIVGLEPYNPEKKVSQKELINIVYQVLLGSKQIRLDSFVSNNMVAALKSSGLKKNDSYTATTVTREEAIAMFTRLYEIKNNVIIEPSSYALSSVANNASISNDYKLYIAKAATIGMVSNVNSVRPKDAIKFGELFVLWSKIDK